MFTDEMWSRIAQSLRLSGRELQLIRGVFDNLTEEAIAVSIEISPHTVHTHFERLHHKLSVISRAQLLLRVFETFLCVSDGAQQNGADD